MQRFKIKDYIVFDNNVLNIIFKYINQPQLFKFRLISKQWNNIVLMHINEINISPNSNNNILKTFYHLTSLTLSGNNTITNNELKYLKHLIKLNLCNNTIITDNGLKHLKHLISLDLSHNKTITDDGINILNT